MKYINGLLYTIGVVLIFVGIYLLQTDLMAAIKLMPTGFAAMFIGWILDELFVQEAEEYELEDHLRHMY